jgi:hypothetical protein
VQRRIAREQVPELMVARAGGTPAVSSMLSSMASHDLSQDSAFQVASKLSRRQFERYLRAREAEAAMARGEEPPSTLGRLFKPAETERKLVLFTLGIVVILLLLTVLVLELWASDEDASPVTTPLITLAGTALGFIGGMVSDRRRRPDASTTPALERSALAARTEGQQMAHRP